MVAIQLGFAEEILDGPLPTSIHDFPNKIGGKPIWLNKETALTADRVTCGVCEKPMVLLLQFYTPEDEPAEAFHRVIYLFCCRNGTCHRMRWRDCFKAIRSQLPEVNNCYDAETGDEIGEAAHLCDVCGLAGPKQCGRCHSARYCSREHQVNHWSHGGHKAACSGSTIAPSTSIITTPPTLPPMHPSHRTIFAEFELVSEDEPPSATPATAALQDEDALSATLSSTQISPSTVAEDPDEDMEETEVDVDKAFLRFQKRVLREPEQVVRYARVAYDGQDQQQDEELLWVSDAGRPEATDVPACPLCEGPRTFEFQAMPQLLNHLDVDHSTADALDWGTVVVYSCAANCHPGDGRPYVEELVWRQMFSEDGMGDSARAALRAQQEAKARAKAEEETGESEGPDGASKAAEPATTGAEKNLEQA
ncbi:Programmed cell death protein 2 [Thoreauomyces humboldtii]|nr:Programmed cell death protein 2 [Thoreauomyces humboldtii]